MIGVPGSGKTTVAKFLAKTENAIIISSDEVRLKLIGNGIFKKQEDAFTKEGNKLVFETMYKHLREIVESGNNVIVDAQNIYAWNRKNIFDALGGLDCYYIAYVMQTNQTECECRVEKRAIQGDNNGFDTKPQSRFTIEQRLNMLELPTKEEGFHEIKFIDEKQQSEIFKLLNNTN